MSGDKLDKNFVNPEILRCCRKQMALEIEEVQHKVPMKNLSDIESGKRQPTLNQIEKLSQLYLIPSWVFMQESLPDEYNFSKTIPSFRKFKNSYKKNFDYKLRCLTAKVESFRKTIVELREEMEEPVFEFSPPDVVLNRQSITRDSQTILDWLGAGHGSFSFSEWRKKIEDKGIFIFVTSPFSSWSKIDPRLFRGLSIYHDRLPIIIINGSDTYKAKSFTLFHELGHLLRKKTAFDEKVGEAQSEEERLCDSFAGEVLMPESRIKDYYGQIDRALDNNNKLNEIRKIAKKFKTSAYATLVRLRNLGVIDQNAYRNIEKIITQNYQLSKSNMEGGIPRVMSKEVRTQYGQIYSETIIQAYLGKQITLHKARNMFGLKKTEHILKMIQRVA